MPLRLARSRHDLEMPVLGSEDDPTHAVVASCVRLRARLEQQADNLGVA